MLQGIETWCLGTLREPTAPTVSSESPANMDSSPISILPVELLVKIFQASQAVESDTAGDAALSSSKTYSTPALIISHVCHLWREAALSCKHLWTDITVHEHTNMEFLDFLWTQLRDAPASLDIIGPLTGIAFDTVLDAAVRKIHAHPNQIRSLTTATNARHCQRLFKSFPGLLSNLENFNASLVISQYSWTSVESSELGRLISQSKAPKLRSIRLCENIAIPWSSPFMQSLHLTEMHNRFGTDREQRDSTTLYRLLARSTNLRELSVSLKYGSMNGDNMLFLSPLDLTHIVKLELTCNQWSFTVDNFFRSVRISWHNMTQFSLRAASSFRGYYLPVDQLWDLLRSASSDTCLYPQKFEVGTASHCNFIQAHVDTSNGERPPLELRIEFQAALLFRSPEEYQAAWSFEKLQHIEIRDCLPDHLWSLLIEHRHLRYLGFHSKEAANLLTILAGTSSSFPNKTAILFPALKTLGVLDQPSHRWYRMRGPDENFADYGPQQRRYTPEEEYVLDFVSALRARALRTEALVDEDDCAEGLLTEIQFSGCRDNLAKDIHEALELVAKNVVWSRAGS